MTDFKLQTPNQVLLVGSGRLARHFAFAWPFFFGSENSSGPLETDANLRQIPNLVRWARRAIPDQPEIATGIDELCHLIQQSQVIALAIRDSDIATFESQWRHLNPSALWIHFSGALVVENMVDYHPLMTFGPSLYSREQYQSIPFVTASTVFGSQWPDEFPLRNPLFAIAPQTKALYHALCVMSGNFSSILWAKAQTEFEKIGLPSSLLRPYATQSLENVFSDRESSLTGPLVRNDLVTQEKNLAALQADPFVAVYKAFQSIFQTTDSPSPHPLTSEKRGDP